MFLRKINKKGDVSDGIIFIIVIFFLAVTFLIGAFVNDKFKDVIQDTVLNQSAAADDIINGLDRMTTTSIQRGYVMIFAFLIIGMMISSFLIRVHPAWIFLYILFLGFAVVVAVPLANTYNILANTAVMSNVASQQTMITWVMEHCIKILIGAVALSMIILFAKLPEGGRL